MKRFKKTIIVLVSILLVMGITCGVFLYEGRLHKVYKGSQKAYEILETKHDYRIETLDDGSICFVPSSPIAGYVFYQGGMVDYKSYSPLMDELARNNILCILLKSDFNFPLINKDIADKKKDLYPNVTNWYIGGHSMGAYVSSLYLQEHVDEYDGLILLAGYSDKDYSNSNLKALCIYGSLDGIMNRKLYDENKILLPRDFQEVIIEGGCHSYFGDYGLAVKDKEPTISQEEQIKQTCEAIIEFVNE